MSKVKRFYFIIACVLVVGAAAAPGQETASSNADTSAVDTVVVDTTAVVEDVHPEELKESKFEAKVLGVVRVNAFYDLEGMEYSEGFRPIDIPVGADDTERFQGLYLGARQSRLGVESTALTSLGPLKTYIEGDFVGPQGTFTFRLRHAYGQLKYWTLGQTWSTAMDLEALPLTVDFEGPNSAVLLRQGLARFQRRFGEPYIFGIGVENPKSDFTNPFDTLEVASRQSNFDVTSRIKYRRERGHVQLSGIFRAIGYTVNSGDKQHAYGGGVVLSARGQTHRDGNILLQAIAGKGISRYINGLSGAGLDGVITPSGKLELFDAFGWYLAYQWNWSNSVLSSVVVGSTNVRSDVDVPPDFFRRGDYGTVDTFWEILPTVSFGFGVTVGRRVNNDGQKGNAERIGFIGRFSF